MKPSLAKLQQRFQALQERNRPVPLIVFATNPAEIESRKAGAIASYRANNPKRRVECLVITWADAATEPAFPPPRLERHEEPQARPYAPTIELSEPSIAPDNAAPVHKPSDGSYR